MPPLHNCHTPYQQNRNTGTCQSDSRGDDSNNLCSPFCGEDGCGIVIITQAELPPSIVLPFIIIERYDRIVNLSSSQIISLWHPPKA